ncbi:MAG TPA: hypothetical protein VGK25_09825 [Ignavibacteria bacterium]|jgi:hypothetical protein
MFNIVDMDTGTIILILSFLTPVVVIIIIFMGMKRGFKKQANWAKELKEKQAKARPFNAKVINSSQGTTGGDIKRIIYFDFEIIDPVKPYNASAAWFVDTLKFNLIQPGCFIAVKVDADDPMKIYPDVPWAVYTEGYEGLKGLAS